jgi:threonine aldolase
MARYSFKNDYSEGAHPSILQALSKSNLEQQEGYGLDDYCNQARDILKKAIKNPDADIYFVSGGTQANLLSISSILKPWESVISANSGHINTHEAGAIESTGHKIDTIQSKDGKISVSQLKPIIEEHKDEHMVKPRLVFISNSTEVGTIYKKKELEELSSYCKTNNLILYLDGARIGSALCSTENDLTLSEISKLVDIFYIGGTKNGALFGEAVIINNSEIKKDFFRSMKQRGALLAKGRTLGVQFIELFKKNLFFDLAKHSNLMASKIAEAIKKRGYNFLTESSTNQIFPILPNKLIEKLEKKYGFYVWCKIDNNNSAIRLVTSWTTNEEVVKEFISDLSIK